MNFFAKPEPVGLSVLVTGTGATLERGDPAATIDAIGPVEDSEPGALSFVTGGRYLQALTDTSAAAVVVAPRHLERVPEHVAAITAADPYSAFAKMAMRLYPQAERPLPVTGETGISERAYVAAGVELSADVVVEAGAVVGRGAKLARGVHVLAGAVVGAGVEIGENSSIGANASVQHATIGAGCILHQGSCVGQDGFGYAMGPGGHVRVPQIGGVRVHNGVDIGAGTTIDRGANRDTIIGAGTKIDNLVQIGHNCVIGRHCVIAGGVMMAGSCELGDFVVMGGGTCVTGHCRIGTGVQIGGMSGISEDIASGQKVGGIPARPIRHWMKEIAAVRRAGRKDER